MHDLIIEIPNMQSIRRKYSYATLTFVFWTIYIYLWLPLLSLLAWGMGFKFFYEHMITLGGYVGLMHSAAVYTFVIFIISSIFILWAQINLYRFEGIDRRSTINPILVKDQADYYSLTEQQAHNWQEAKNLVIHHNDDGYPVRAEQT